MDAAVELVGLTPSGDMDTPKGLGNVAWFNLGSRPGESGSAVITGHSGIWENGEETVFNNLHTLRKDDTFSIEDEKGVISTFIVRESRKYDPEADASDVFISNDGKSHLNLITCIGRGTKLLRAILIVSWSLRIKNNKEISEKGGLDKPLFLTLSGQNQERGKRTFLNCRNCIDEEIFLCYTFLAVQVA